MSKQEYLQKLKDLLLDIPEEEREAALVYYRDYFEDAGEGEEERVIEELGSPETVAAQIKDGLSGGDREKGEFTDQGFWDERYQERVFPERKGFFGDEGGKRAESHGKEGPFNEDDRKRKAKPSGGNSVWKVLLIIFLCVIALPVGIPLLVTAFVAGVCVLAVIFSLGVSVLAVAFSAALVIGIMVVIFFGVGAVFFVWGITHIVAAPPMGLILAGIGLLMLAFGLLMLLLAVWIGGTALPVVARGTVNLFKWMLNKLFFRRRGQRV